MSGPLKWWANRKSKIGMTLAARKPPHIPGRQWWTDPPKTIPQPECIEYAVQYQLEIMRMPASQERNALQAHVGAWLRSARRLLHEEMQSHDRADLHTTDGLLIAADDAIRSAILACHKAGVRLDESVFDVHHELRRSCSKLRRERAEVSARTVSIQYWDQAIANGPVKR